MKYVSEKFDSYVLPVALHPPAINPYFPLYCELCKPHFCSHVPNTPIAQPLHGKIKLHTPCFPSLL